jgi:hypothetical protein
MNLLNSVVEKCFRRSVSIIHFFLQSPNFSLEIHEAIPVYDEKIHIFSCLIYRKYQEALI